MYVVVSLEYLEKFIIPIDKKSRRYKISPCGLPDLQFTPYGIKTNLKVPMVYKRKQFSPYR
jgi:hypothetical protein